MTDPDELLATLDDLAHGVAACRLLIDTLRHGGAATEEDLRTLPHAAAAVAAGVERGLRCLVHRLADEQEREAKTERAVALRRR